MAGPMTEEQVKEAVKTPDDSTTDFIFQQTMFRIKDPKASLAFYTGLTSHYFALRKTISVKVCWE